MERYNPDTICPKCGCREPKAYSGGKPPEGRTSIAFLAETTEESDRMEKKYYYEKANSIELECWRCGYNIGKFWALDVEKDFDGNPIEENHNG